MEHYAKFDVHAAQQHVAPAVLGFFRSVALGQASGTKPSAALVIALHLICAAFQCCLSVPPFSAAFQYEASQTGCLSAVPNSCLLADRMLLPDLLVPLVCALTCAPFLACL